MPDINATYAGLSLLSPIIVESNDASTVPSIARAASESGAGALSLPTLTAEVLSHRDEEGEVTENNQDDTAGRLTGRLTRKLNLERYVARVQELTTHVDIPLIAPVEISPRIPWLSLCEYLSGVGVHAIELRVNDGDTHHRKSDHVEKMILRPAMRALKRIEIPIIVEVRGNVGGLLPFAQALGHAGAAALSLPPDGQMVEIDTQNLQVVPFHDSRSAQEAAFLSLLGRCRQLYRRVSPHISVHLPLRRSTALIEALLSGSTVGHLDVTGLSEAQVTRTIKTMRTTLIEHLRAHEFGSLFDARGFLSESRLSSSLDAGANEETVETTRTT